MRVHLTDGRTIPVDCVLVGYDSDCAIWQVQCTYPRDMVRSLTVGVLPAKTSLQWQGRPHG